MYTAWPTDTRNLLTARIDLAFTHYSSAEKVRNFSEAVLSKVRALPGVTSASIGTNPPQFGGWQNNFYKEGIGRPDNRGTNFPRPGSVRQKNLLRPGRER